MDHDPGRFGLVGQGPGDASREGFVAAGKGCTARTDYVRYALIEGLREAERIGVNPYEFGFIGSTDTHSATPGAAEEEE